MAHVLIVDDEHSIRLTLSRFLKHGGYVVSVAENVDEALKVIRSDFVDVIITDIIMPRLTGIDLLKALADESPDSKVIIMTGEPTAETAAEAVRHGAFDYLFKPVDKQLVVDAVERALNSTMRSSG